MSTFLTLSTTGNTAAQRIKPISGETPAQSRVRQNLGGLSQAYHALTMTQKGGWQLVANTLNSTQNRVGKHKLSASNAFSTINSALLTSGQATLANAPAALSAPPILPNLTVDSTAPTPSLLGAAGPTDPHFIMTLTSPTAYPSPIHIQAAAPAPAGKNTFPDNTFKTIGSIPSLTTTTDITSMYQNTYGTPEPGSQIALRLIAVSPSGIRLAPLTLTGTVTDAGLAKNENTPLQIT